MKLKCLTSGSAKFVLMILVTIAPWVVFAQGTSNDPVERKAQLTYLGSRADSAIVLLEVKNENAEKVFVSIQQKDGQILYREAFTDKNISKRFFMPREIATEVNFVVSDAKDKNRQVFQLNTRLVEEVFVTKAD
jgi:hypothetical protein